ncbi:MAG: HlyD family secretion protein [Oceanicoccus sp.]|jgi:HlyD family secretion protein
MNFFAPLIIVIFLVSCDQPSENVALGTLERDRIAHAATVNEVVVELPIAEGTLVKKGTVLVKLNDIQQKALLSKARADVNKAEANLDKLHNGARKEEVAAARARVEGSKAALIVSEADFRRASNLVKRRLSSQATLDRALASRDSAIAALNNDKEQLLVLVNGTREEDLRIAEADLAAAQAVQASEEKRLADLTIISTRDGVLDSLPWNLGERVTVGSPLAIVLSGASPYARIYVPETYRVKLSVGDNLVVHVDGIDEAIEGRLRWISSEPAFTPYYALNQQERSRLMFLAEVQLPDSESHLPNGIPAQVEMQ